MNLTIIFLLNIRSMIKIIIYIEFILFFFYLLIISSNKIIFKVILIVLRIIINKILSSN